MPVQIDPRGACSVIPQCAIFVPGIAHGGELAPVETGCEHEHVQHLQGCYEHRILLGYAEKNFIAFQCPDCSHACRIMVTADGQVYRFNQQRTSRD